MRIISLKQTNLIQSDFLTKTIPKMLSSAFTPPPPQCGSIVEKPIQAVFCILYTASVHVFV